ncbi:MAG TPA: L-fucose:H+ symporter permease, partial [Terracidiphilus sp.]|nr:L-fucose:H+ symporter permease [Terracidiphilus sp.]
FVFAVLAQFLYVGAQVGSWSYMILYVQAYAGLGERNAGYLLTLALAAFTVGRFVSTALLRHVHASRLLALYGIINTVLCGLAAMQPGWTGVVCLIANSFFMSMMYPTIFALGVKGLGARTKTGSSFIVMSIVGGAVLTLVMGRLADVAGVAISYVVPAACFAVIALYALFASEPDPEELAAEPGLAEG